MKKFVLLLVMLAFHLGMGQNQEKIDSLKNELQKIKVVDNNQDEILKKAKAYFNLGSEYLEYDLFEECLKNYDDAEGLLNKLEIKEDELFTTFYFNKGVYFRILGKYKIADSIFNISLNNAERLKLKDHIYKAKNQKALMLFYLGKAKESILAYEKIEKSLKIIDSTDFNLQRIVANIYGNKAIVLANTGDLENALINFKNQALINEKAYKLNAKSSQSNLIDIYNNVALCLDMLQNPKEAITYYYKGLEVANKEGLPDKSYRIYSNLGKLFLNQFDHEKSIEYSEKATASKVPTIRFSAYNNLGVAYSNIKRYRESSDAYINALKLSNSINRPTKQALIHINLGVNYLRLKKNDSSYYHLNSAKNINSSLQNDRVALMLNDGFGKYYFETGNHNKALNLFKKYHNQAKLNENTPEFYRSCDNLYNSYRLVGDSKNALKWLEMKYASNKNIDSLRTVEKVNELETKYQTQQKENEILKLTNDNLLKDADLSKSRMANFGILGAFLVFLIIGYFYWNKRKQAHKLALLENSVKTSEAEKSRIGKALHDGIAGSIMKLVHDSETAQIQLSHKLLQTYNQVRDLSHQLDNTPMHAELFFERVLDIIPENTEKQSYSFEISPRNLQINEPNGTHLFRIIQELITNNLKHANATETKIAVQLDNDVLKLDYSDNGTGAEDFKKGRGIKNIEDRIVLMNGKLSVKTNDGFVVNASFPYNP